MTANGVGRSSDTILVTGSSTGLGLEMAVYLAERGFRVYAAVRDLSSRAAVEEAAAGRKVTLDVIRLDLADRETIAEAVDTIVREAGGIFGLVNNGGVGLRGCLEDVSDEEIREVFEANVFGTIAATKAVLPTMRAARRGRIVTMSSVGGRISSFGVSVYCASKFALEGLGEALALEIAPFGLHAVLIEPGIVKTTRWTSHRHTAPTALDPESPYYDRFRASEALADRLVERSRTRPVDVAKAVHRALTTRNPRIRYVVGQPASAVVVLRRYLPERLFERLYFGSFLRQIARGATTAAERPTARPSGG
jgi:NAD(P)-dependent dehydrogenase (short-subunit alcohol dehydrogenase family)